MIMNNLCADWSHPFYPSAYLDPHLIHQQEDLQRRVFQLKQDVTVDTHSQILE